MSDVGLASSDGPKGRQYPPLLNVTQLREILERIERNGGGDWEVDIFPDSAVARSTEQDDIDFGFLSYGITCADTLGGDGVDDFVLLRFAPAPLNARRGHRVAARANLNSGGRPASSSTSNGTPPRIGTRSAGQIRS